MKKFNVIVEEIKELSFDEKEELHLLLEKYLIEARRDEVHANYKSSKAHKKKNFSSSTSYLRRQLSR